MHLPIFVRLGVLLVCARAAADTVSLNDAWNHALESTESVRTEKSRLAQTEEKANQSVAGLLPDVNFTASYVRQETPAASGGSTSFFFNPDQENARLSLTQPLFRGLREFAELRRTKALRRAGEAEVENAKLRLFGSVAQSFYGYLSARKDVQNLDGLLELTQKRIKEMSERVKIGRSRKGDLLSAKAQSATLSANLEAAKSDEAQARESFLQTTGYSEGTLPLEAPAAPFKPLQNWDTYLTQLDARADIRARKEALQAADEVVTIAWGAHLPSVDAVGNWYFKRPGTLADVRWDVGVFLTVPIFQGGEIQSKVREASEARKESELNLAQTRRQAVRDLKVIYDQLGSSVVQLAALNVALELAEQNYKEQSRDYRYGLVTNLDVLQALNTLQESRRSWDRTRYQQQSLLASFDAALGHHP